MRFTLRYGRVDFVDLGQSLSVHRGSLDFRGWLLQLGVVGLFAGTSGLAGIGSKQTLAARAPASVGMLLLGLALLVVPLLHWRQRVEIFERGLIWSRLFATVRIAAEQVENVSWIKPQPNQSSHDAVKLVLSNGQQYTLIGLAQSEQLVNFLRSWATRRAGALPHSQPS